MRASSCASTTTRRARSVNRSNISSAPAYRDHLDAIRAARTPLTPSGDRYLIGTLRGARMVLVATLVRWNAGPPTPVPGPEPGRLMFAVSGRTGVTPSVGARPGWGRAVGAGRGARSGRRALATHLVDVLHRLPQLGEPAVGLLADEPDAPRQGLGARPGDTGLDKGVEHL